MSVHTGLPLAIQAAGAASAGASSSDSRNEAMLRDWLGQGGLTTISDYDPARDQIVLVYDSAVHPTPGVAVRQVAGSNRTLIMLDGHVIAAVHGKIRPADICLLST